MYTAPTFPPLLRGAAVSARTDPMQKALAMAEAGDEVDPGLVHYCESDRTFRVALTLAPEEPLRHALRGTFAAMLGASDALGALGPPEVAVHFVWPGGIKVNGARCGALRLAAPISDPDAEPAWLIAALDLDVASSPERDTGVHKDRTTLHDEGCGEITVPALIESWSRHTLVWINRYLDEGFAPVLTAWQGKCDTVGETVTSPENGTFVGLDPDGGMMLRQGDRTRTIPLHDMLGAMQ